MIELFLIRHGEAVGQGNYLGRRSDPPLSENGRSQIVALKSIIPQAENSRIYSSPMRRALETSSILFDSPEDAASVNQIEDLSEMDFGDWDGLSWKDISLKADMAYRAWLDDPVTLSPPGGENLTVFNSRIDSGFKSVMYDSRSHGIEKIFLVAHGGVIRSILCLLLGLPLEMHWSFKIDTASVSCVKLFTEPGVAQTFRLDFLNLTATQ